jgi:hypothetical protein
LAELRLVAIEASEKRMPYWRFRLASNIVLKLQPKLTNRLLVRFEGKALMCEGANAKLLDASYKDLVHPHWRFGFEVTAKIPEEWCFLYRGATWSGPQRYDMPREHNMAKVAELRERVVAAFRDGWFNVIRPEMTLSQHCLICGKGLTDPVSMARFIGPECASKEYAPRVLRLFAEAVV